MAIKDQGLDPRGYLLFCGVTEEVFGGLVLQSSKM